MYVCMYACLYVFMCMCAFVHEYKHKVNNIEIFHSTAPLASDFLFRYEHTTKLYMHKNIYMHTHIYLGMFNL